MGSNTKFKRFLSKENVDSSLPIKEKYKTAALHYYRMNLKAKVEGKDEIKQEFKDPNEILNDIYDNYPEFNKKYVVKIGSRLNIYLIKYLIEQRKKEEEASIKRRKMILLRLI